MVLVPTQKHHGMAEGVGKGNCSTLGIQEERSGEERVGRPRGQMGVMINKHRNV